MVRPSHTALSAPSTSPKIRACVFGTWSVASGRASVRFILASMSASTTQFSACALAAATAPPTSVANTSHTDGRWPPGPRRPARNIAGTVTTSSCSMIRVLVSDR